MSKNLGYPQVQTTYHHMPLITSIALGPKMSQGLEDDATVLLRLLWQARKEWAVPATCRPHPTSIAWSYPTLGCSSESKSEKVFLKDHVVPQDMLNDWNVEILT